MNNSPVIAMLHRMKSLVTNYSLSIITPCRNAHSATFFSECDTCEAKAYHDALLFGIDSSVNVIHVKQKLIMMHYYLVLSFSREALAFLGRFLSKKKFGIELFKVSTIYGSHAR